MSEKIFEALKKLDTENANHWTATGEPRLDTVRMLASDHSITRESLNQVAGDFNRENAKEWEPKESSVESSEAEEVEVEAPQKTVVSEKKSETKDENNSNTAESEIDINSALEQQTKIVDELRAVKNKVDSQYAEAVRIQDQLIEQVTIGRGKVKDGTSSAIKDYHNSQLKLLQDRAERKKLLSESGIDLSELSRNLKSPLDSAMSRKNSRGQQRPGPK